MNPNYTPVTPVNAADLTYNQQGQGYVNNRAVNSATGGYVNPGYNTTGYTAPYTNQNPNILTPTQQSVGFTRGENMKWNNPYGLSIPVITFSPGCKKCHGTGTSHSTFTNTPVPCTRCYTRQGYCKKCYGTGTNYRKGKACNKCQAGKRMNNKSSSSSDSH